MSERREDMEELRELELEELEEFEELEEEDLFLRLSLEDLLLLDFSIFKFYLYL